MPSLNIYLTCLVFLTLDKERKATKKNIDSASTEFCIDPVKASKDPKINIPTTIAIFSVTS